MKIVRIICQDVQERLFWTKNLRFIGHSALGMAGGMVLVGFIEAKLDDFTLQAVVAGVCVAAVGVFVFRSYRAFKERLRMGFAGQLERLNPEFEDRFATLAHLEGMTLDPDQRRIYDAIAMQVAPKVKTMRRGAMGEQVLLPLLIACVFLIPGSLLFPGTRNAIWRLMKQLDQVQIVKGPKLLKTSDLVKERVAQGTAGEVRIIKPDEKLSMSLYETADVMATVRAKGEVAEVRASFWKNGKPLAPKRLEWSMSQREGDVSFTIFPEDYGLDLLDVLAFEVDARIQVTGKDVWVRSKVHVIEICPFAEDRERLRKGANNRDLRALDDLSAVIREQACLAAELQKALEEKQMRDAKRPEAGGNKPTETAENKDESREQEVKRKERLKEASLKQLEATERVGKSCPNGSKAGKCAADAMGQAANGSSAISTGNLEEAAHWQKEALQSLTAARKELMETMKSDAERQSASRGSGGDQKLASERSTEQSGAGQTNRNRGPESSGSANRSDDRASSAASSEAESRRAGEVKGESGGQRGGTGGSGVVGKRDMDRSGRQAVGGGGAGTERDGELGRRSTIRHPEEDARAAVNEYLNRPEQELLSPPSKPSAASSSERTSGWQTVQERELQDAINSARTNNQRARDQVFRRNQELRKERLEDALHEVDRFLEILEQSGGSEKASALRAMLPEQDRRELEKMPKLPGRSAVPFHERDIAESARRVSESIAKRIEAGRELSPQQLESLMKESALNVSPEKTTNRDEDNQGTSPGTTLQPGLGASRVVDRSTTEGNVDRNQVEISAAVKVKKAGEDEAAEVDRVPLSFRSRVERYFRKLATE